VAQWPVRTEACSGTLLGSPNYARKFPAAVGLSLERSHVACPKRYRRIVLGRLVGQIERAPLVGHTAPTCTSRISGV